MASYNPLDPAHLIRLNQRRAVWQRLVGLPLLAVLLAALAWLVAQPRDGLGMGKLILDSQRQHWLSFGRTLWVGSELGESRFQLETGEDSALGGPITDLCASQSGGVVLASANGLISWLGHDGEIRQQYRWNSPGALHLACLPASQTVLVLETESGLLHQLTPQGKRQLIWRGPLGISSVGWGPDRQLWLTDPGNERIVKLRLQDLQVEIVQLPSLHNFRQPTALFSDETDGFWLIRQVPGGLFGRVEHHSLPAGHVTTGQLPWASNPVQLARGFDQRLLIVDQRRNSVLQLTAEGEFLDEFGDRHLRHQLSQFRWRGLKHPLAAGAFCLLLILSGTCLFHFGRQVVYWLQAGQLPHLKHPRDRLLKAPTGSPTRLVHWATVSALLPVPGLIWLTHNAGVGGGWRFAVLALVSVALASTFLQFQRHLPDYLPFAGRARWLAIPSALNQAVSQAPGLAKQIRQHGAIYLVLPSREGLLLFAERALLVLGQRLDNLAPRPLESYPYGSFQSAHTQKVRLARRFKGLPSQRVILQQPGEEPQVFHLGSKLESRLFLQWFYRLHPTLRHHNPETRPLQQPYRYMGCLAALSLGGLLLGVLQHNQGSLVQFVVAITSAIWLGGAVWIAGWQAEIRPQRRSYDYAIR